MTRKKTLVRGTILLAGAGFLSRILGFYNRILLSRVIGAKELGIYQLIFPVFMIGFAFCCSGIEISLSKFVAAMRKEDHASIEKLMKIAFVFALFLSFIFCLILFIFAPPISTFFFHNTKITICLRIVAVLIPFLAVKSCLHGYCMGMERPFLLASGQLLEQIVRVICIYLLSLSVYFQNNKTALLAACGLFAGEFTACLYTIAGYLLLKKKKAAAGFSKPATASSLLFKKLFWDYIPLTANKLSFTLLASLETMLIPAMLNLYYTDASKALTQYGILTGMTLSFLFFPSTITNALSVMLLPSVSYASKNKEQRHLHSMITASSVFCILMGLCAFALFFLYGNQLGVLIFHNKQCGQYLHQLSFLCPVLYLSATLTSILNGLDKTFSVLKHQIFCLAIRIAFILFAVPTFGMQGYFLGLIVAYSLLILLHTRKICTVL